VVERPHGRIVRVTGSLAGKPRGFISLDRQIIGVAEGDLTLSRIAVAYALGKLKKTPSALRGAALSTLPKPEEDALATFYVPGPFDGEWSRAAHGVLAAALAVALSVNAVQDGYLRLTLYVSGEWGGAGPAAAEELKRAFDELAATATGKLFALERARAVTSSFHPQYLTLSAELPLDPLARGLRAAVVADVWEILDLPPPRPSDAGAVP
jgi:hypothetical protein